MNCHQTRELISAYSDQELTGQQMLEIGAHLHLCPSCAREWREINDVRRLLRALVSPTPEGDAEDKLAARLECEQAWNFLGLSVSALHVMPAPRAESSRAGGRLPGRQAAYACALASVVLLAVAAPFAPSTGDAAGTTFLSSPSNLPASVALPPGIPPAGLMPSLRLTGAANAYEADPLQDGTISGYFQGEATLAGYQTSGIGAR